VIGICQTTFAQIRPAPKHASELISQLVLGEWVFIAEIQDDWCKIETEHGYQGYTRINQLNIVSAKDALNTILGGIEISTRPGKNFRSLNSTSLLNPGIFNYPNAAGFIQNTSSEEFGWKDISNPIEFNTRQLDELCNSLQGIPYVWGGKTLNGLDCSGLVQCFFQQLGYSFPRDAWQQAEIGETIALDKEKPVLKPGDLLFFQRPGKRIHHVAISNGGHLYFHASEWTRQNSLDHANDLFVQDRFDTLVLVKRVSQMHLTILKDSFITMIQMDN